ncbi:SDR family NAD(P)-dependent oxidoreductase [Marinicellulosiphila megalodicopiae]|uniref:SDR family NAD(P)-dependent oxidoreductase n=1 Tax=Marinicellulosiphila megalodicopiae TaxID=2724896 RepID=UPI003BAF7D66
MNFFITGASSGIGLSCAMHMQALGHNVAVTVRKETDRQRLESIGFYVVMIDLTNIELIKPVFDQVVDHFDGQLDVLVNNAAFGQVGALEDIKVDVLKAQFNVNFFAVHELTICAIKQMRIQNGGKIVQISSVLGLVSMKMRGGYNSSKYALEGLCDTLRLELKGSNIHVSLIEPGPITSNFRKNALINFEKTVDIKHSVFNQDYQTQLTRLKKQGKAARFTLPAKACANKLEKIVKSKRPSARYYVTFPTYLFGFLKRILPASWLDNILARS